MSASLVSVRMGGQRWLVRVADLREVVPMMSLGQVAGQAGTCRGVLNLRGELIPVFDGSGGDAPLASSRLILVLREREGTHVGLLVDEADEVLVLPEAQLAPRPVGGGRVRRMALVDGECCTVLEPDEVAVHGG